MTQPSSPEQLLIECEGPEELLSAVREVVRQCPRETRFAVLRIWGRYLHFFGTQGVFERFNKRTVGQVLSEFECSGIRPIASGKIYEAPAKTPNEKPEDGESGS